jgi:diguanylate cyclase (GGDEF)-like protein
MTQYNNRLFAERVKILYENAPTVIPTNIVVAGVLGLFLLPVLRLERIVAWWSIMVAVCVVRYFQSQSALKHANWFEDAPLYHLYFAFFAFLTGATWAAAFFLFAFVVPDVYLIFIIFAIGGMCVGAIGSMSTSKLCFFAYMIPMALPPAIVFLFDGTALGYAMSGMMIIYTMSISLTFVQGYARTIKAMKIQIENEDLVEHLKISNEELASANQKIMILSNTDALTQIANRRQMDAALKTEWARAVRSNIPLCFIMLDIDFFKAYNDKFGHPEGDACLQQIARVLRGAMKRTGDIVARYGGEEFAIILPDTELSGGYALMCEVQADIYALQIPTANQSVSPWLTVSAGIACIRPNPSHHMSQLIAAADTELYNAKQLGRNRIEQIQINP